MDLEKIRKGEVKNLRDADLKWADLRESDLRCADLRDADLKWAYLSEANLSCANLRYTDLRYTDLRKAYLRYTNLRYTDLSCADLRKAYLRDADLSCADLSCADLRGVNLSGANLRGADLRYTNLRGVNLSGADLRSIKTNYLTIGYNMACPEEGSFIGYKKARNCLVKLLILEDSKRSSGTTSKCRCDKAKVLEIEDIVTGEKINKVRSEFDKDFIYTVGEIIKVDDFDEDRWNECSTGIYFFVNKENAINY